MLKPNVYIEKNWLCLTNGEKKAIMTKNNEDALEMIIDLKRRVKKKMLVTKKEISVANIGEELWRF